MSPGSPAPSPAAGPLPLVWGALVVALGGAAGATLRALVAAPDDRIGTLLVNVAGSAAIGLVGGLITTGALHLFLAPGLLGGFTTMSAWAEQVRLSTADAPVAAASLLVATPLLCVAAAALGLVLARWARRGRPGPEGDGGAA